MVFLWNVSQIEQVSDVFRTLCIFIEVVDWTLAEVTILPSVWSHPVLPLLWVRCSPSESQPRPHDGHSSSCRSPAFICCLFAPVHAHPAAVIFSGPSKPSAFSQGALGPGPSWLGCSHQRAERLTSSFPSGVDSAVTSWGRHFRCTFFERAILSSLTSLLSVLFSSIACIHTW